MNNGSSDAYRQAVFADTSFLFAYMVERDALNADAGTIYESVVGARRRIVTSNLVMIELHSLMTRRVSASFATMALLTLEASSLRIIRATEDDEIRARNILRQYTDKGFSLLDATSFVVMERLGIDTALSFDRHFAQYRWTVLGA